MGTAEAAGDRERTEVRHHGTKVPWRQDPG